MLGQATNQDWQILNKSSPVVDRPAGPGPKGPKARPNIKVTKARPWFVDGPNRNRWFT